MMTKKELITEYQAILAAHSAYESKMNERLGTLMAKLDKKIEELEEPLFHAKDLKVGEMMVIISESSFNDHVIMRIYDVIVSLTNPEFTWGNPEMLSFTGRKLKKGETFTLTQK